MRERIAGSFDGEGRTLVGKAYDLAEEIHAKHTRDNGDPYLVHPCRVALILIEEFGTKDADLVAAALLHDVLEMSEMSESELSEMFNPETARLVSAVSKPRQRSGDWEDGYYSGIRSAGREAQILKFADRLDNIRDLKNAPEEKRERYLRATRERFLPWMRDVDMGFYRKLSYEIERLEE